MDGGQGPLKNSLQLRLSAGLSLVIVGVALAAGTASFVVAYNEAIELQDEQLRQTAAIVGPQSPTPGAVATPDTEVEARLVVQRLAPAPAAAPAAAAEVVFPPTLADGLQTAVLRGVSWRVFVKRLADGTRVAIGQRTALRAEIARDSALLTVTPVLVLVPLLLLLARHLIGAVFAPLRALAAALDRRTGAEPQAIADAALPAEIQPFVQAIDRLLARLAQAAALQRRFVADAAHELRSPLTALSLQAEQLEAAGMSAPARQRLAALRGGIQRTRALLEQLLALARAQSPPRGADAAVSLARVLREVLEDLLPLAEAKAIDLGVDSGGDARVQGHAIDLATLAKNLVDNAIRYTPAGGRIDLRIGVEDGHGLLQVDDDGPGIPEHERERVFDPFYRVVGSGATGSGLGLSIVRTIAERLGARVTLGSAGGRGLRVRVLFPAAATPPPFH